MGVAIPFPVHLAQGGGIFLAFNAPPIYSPEIMECEHSVSLQLLSRELKETLGNSDKYYLYKRA